MSSIALPPQPTVWKESSRVWIALAVAAALLYALFHVGVDALVNVWNEKEEYSHGFIIPFIAIFLIWQRKDRLERLALPGSWLGLPLVVFGIVLKIAGDMSGTYLLLHYGFLVALYGVALAYLGVQGFRTVLVPMLILIFMIPLPGFVLLALSSELQLLSSKIGVALIRVCDISVYLEGNVIDLGQMQLQVAEACSGLRYLFPLMTLGFIAAYFFKGEMWKRVLIFLASIPITVLMNSARIGMIGVTVEYWGKSMAEGFLHDFEGWAVFMASVAVLIALMWVLARVGRTKLPLRSAFGLDFPEPTPPDAKVAYRTLPAPFIAACGLLLAAAVAGAALPERSPIKPERKDFGAFPTEIGGLPGRTERVDQIYLDILKPDDYLLANFLDAERVPVNLFIGYFASQTRGATPHSPRVCLPSGGWQIASMADVALPTVMLEGRPLEVNRAVIRKGEHSQLVYFWFQQRGRNTTGEYETKWYVFYDAVMRNRSDGSMVRLITPIRPGEDVAVADQRLTSFAAALMPVLPAYLPN